MAHSTYYGTGRLAQKGREGCDLVEKWLSFMNVRDAFFTLFAWLLPSAARFAPSPSEAATSLTHTISC